MPSTRRWAGRQEIEETVFFQAGGLAVILWSQQKLAIDAGIREDRGSFDGITLAHNVRTESEVDALMVLAEQAGARITRPAAKTFYGGYAGYFADPDGHLWEVAHNPGFQLKSDGTLELPDFDGP